MFGLIGRFFLLRFLPRRLLPFLAVIEVFRLLRGVRAATRPVAPQPPRSVTSGGRARVG